MARHLHEQSGGNPRDQGPVPELANEPRSPRSDQDFPDAPETERRSGPGGDLTDAQLDDFAARLGLTDDDDDEERAEPRREQRDEGGEPARAERLRRAATACTGRVRRPAARLLVLMGGVTSSVGAQLRAAGERLDND